MVVNSFFFFFFLGNWTSLSFGCLNRRLIKEAFFFFFFFYGLDEGGWVDADGQSKEI